MLTSTANSVISP